MEGEIYLNGKHIGRATDIRLYVEEPLHELDHCTSCGAALLPGDATMAELSGRGRAHVVCPAKPADAA